jgi:hypothetical protein
MNKNLWRTGCKDHSWREVVMDCVQMWALEDKRLSFTTENLLSSRYYDGHKSSINPGPYKRKKKELKLFSDVKS